MAAEDESDVQAAKLAGAEQAADMAEFDENFSSQAALGVTEVGVWYLMKVNHSCSSGYVPCVPLG